MVKQFHSSCVQFPHFEFLQVSVPSPRVCHCELSRPPVNALNTQLWSELLNLLIHLEENLFPQQIRCLVLSSAANRAIFSAGNDLTELHCRTTDKDRFTNFWLTLVDFLSRLYKSPLYTIAAIRGATPAGGCIMALCCDERFALDDLSIGLNETAVGLVVPRYWGYLFVKTATRHAVAERLLAEGRMITAKDALDLGIIDYIITGTPKDIVTKAIECAEKWATQELFEGRVMVKKYNREEFANQWKDFGPKEAREGWVTISSPKVQYALGQVLRRLTKTENSKM